MTPTAHPCRHYLHGVDVSERQRLEAQAELLGGETFLPAVSPGMRAIDVGCGTGAIARRLAARVAPGEGVGVDREPEQIAAARELATERRRQREVPDRVRWGRRQDGSSHRHDASEGWQSGRMPAARLTPERHSRLAEEMK